MPDIVTDQKLLRKKSESADDLEVGDVIEQLSVSIPGDALGLAAPQIGIYKRIFLANLSLGSYAFVNPKITWTSSDKVPSEEACLSLPNISRCVQRYSQVSISCHKLINMKTGDLVFEPEPMRLKSRDSFIVQHENDHLNGVLIIDLPKVLTAEQKQLETDEKRKERVIQARFKKNNRQPPPVKIPKFGAKNIAKKKRIKEKAKRHQQTLKRRERIRVEIQERYAAEKKDLFSNDTPSASDVINKPEED